MRCVLVLGSLLACSAPPAPQPVRVATRSAIAEVRLPRAEFTVVPAELADTDILARIPHRTRLRRFGDAWLRDRHEPARSRHGGNDTDEVLTVIGETRTKIRVAFEDDYARLAIWIARADTWDTIAIPLELADRVGTIAPDAGIWVTRGAPVELGARVGRLRAVRVRDDLMDITGYAPQAAIAKVWIAGTGDPPITFSSGRATQWSPPADLRTHVKVMIETRIRSAPRRDAPVIASTGQSDAIAVIARNLGDFRQIEIVRPYARIVGYVLASELTHTTEDWGSIGTGRGHGFGMSHADRIDLPAGTCLYESIDGEVVGVQLALSTRLGTLHLDTPKWSLIHVGTSWTTAALYVRDTSDDPTQPRWESCTQPLHR